MKAIAKVRSIIFFVFLSVIFALGACAPVAPDATHAGTQPDPSAFADALSPPGGVPCRAKPPTYTALQRQLGIHGSVRITYVVNTVGQIDLAIVDQSSGNQELDNAAREAVLHATCAPYVVDGVAHRVLQHSTFNFHPAPTSAIHPPPQATAVAPADRVAPATAASSADASLTAESQPVASTAVPPSLPQAIQAAILQKMGIPPNSPRAAQIKRWGERMKNDPDVGRFLGNGPNHASVFSLSPQVRAEFFAEAVLRLSPEERSKLAELASEALDSAPSDCGGVKNSALVMSQHMPLGTMSDADVDSYFGITISMFKQSALQTPLAHVTEEQRAQAVQGVTKTLLAMLRNDAEGTRDVAAAVADPAGVSAEVWCKNARLYNRALLATPQPFRDWSLVAAYTDVMAKHASLSQSETLGTGVPDATPAQDYVNRVRRRVRPNISWAGPTLDLETVITVRCEPGGTIVSATITRSSGNAAWDTAALRAVHLSDPMPLDASGRAPREFVIDMRPAG